MIKGDYKMAARYLEISVSLNPKNSQNHKVLAHCYKKICNSIESVEERKPYYFKALDHDSIAENLGIAPPCPEDYWKTSVGKDKQDSTTVNKNKAAIEYKKKLKELKAKYYDYYE